jgi:DNA-binding LacI/PurR family transcriptional regulator/DNA-binding transcriptional ArsR family regulator
MSIQADVSTFQEVSSPRRRALQLLRAMVKSGAVGVGERLPAEAKLATQMNVSRVTVRSALAVLEREGLVRRERNVGCVRLQNHSPQTSLMSNTVVLLNDHMVAEDAGIFGGTSDAVVSGVIDGVGRLRGKNFYRITPPEGSESWVSELIDARPSGVVVSLWARNEASQVSLIERLAASGLPVVAFGHGDSFDRFDTVRTDHQRGTEQLVHALSRAGKRRILRAWTLDASWIRAHDAGYEKVVHALGLDHVPAIYVTGLLPREAAGEANFRIRARHFAGYLAEHIHCANPVDAIMVSTDWEALVALAACRLYGRTDIPVVGYDNYWPAIPERQWEAGVPFATVDKNNHRLGEELVSLLMQRIAGTLPPEPQTRLIEQRVVITSEIGHSG